MPHAPDLTLPNLFVQFEDILNDAEALSCSLLKNCVDKETLQLLEQPKHELTSKEFFLKQDYGLAPYNKYSRLGILFSPSIFYYILACSTNWIIYKNFRLRALG